MPSRLVPRLTRGLTFWMTSHIPWSACVKIHWTRCKRWQRGTKWRQFGRVPELRYGPDVGWEGRSVLGRQAFSLSSGQFRSGRKENKLHVSTSARVAFSPWKPLTYPVRTEFPCSNDKFPSKLVALLWYDTNHLHSWPRSRYRKIKLIDVNVQCRRFISNTRPSHHNRITCQQSHDGGRNTWNKPLVSVTNERNGLTGMTAAGQQTPKSSSRSANVNC